MSTDEYSEDVPEDLYMHRTPSAASTSYPNLGSSSSCSLPIPSNTIDPLSQMQVQQTPMQQPNPLQPPIRQKRKYIRRKHPEERKKRGPRAKDMNAPRMPLNGYVRFLNANRDRTKQENPELTFAEVTKKLASEWSNMSTEQKKAYLDEAEKEKEKYLKELHEYQKTDSYQEFMEMKQRAKSHQQQPMQEQSLLASSHENQPIPSHSSQMYSDSQQQQQMQYYSQVQPMQSSQYYPQAPQQQQSYYNGTKYSSCMASNGGATNEFYGSYNHSMANYGNSISTPNYQPRPYMAYQNSMQNQAPMNGMGNNYHHNHHNPSSTIGSMDLNDNITGQENELVSTPHANSLSTILEKSETVVDLPIFTEEFLEHNKIREQELRNLRGLTIEFEEKNAISSKHIDDMRMAIEKLNSEQTKGKEVNQRLTSVLDQLKRSLVEHLHDATLPHELLKSHQQQQPNDSLDDSQIDFGPPTLDTLDYFMNGLNKIHHDVSCKEYEPLVQSIRKVTSALDEVTF